MYFLFLILNSLRALILSGFIFILISLLKGRKSLKTFLVIFLICFVVLIPLNLEKYFSPYPYIGTGYLPGFSRENFQKIRAGMSKGEVHQLIGDGFKDRFSTMPQEGEKECVLYSFDQDTLFTDFAWIGTSVCYNAQGLVTRTSEVHVYD